jgi:hypothetical protein
MTSETKNGENKVEQSGDPAFVSTGSLDLVSAPADQRKELWGDIIALPDPNSSGEPKLEARVMMYPDKSRFFVSYPSGKEEVLSAAQFVALVLELKRSRRFSFLRHRP